VKEKVMHLKYQWWRGLVAAVLGGLVGVTAVAAAGAQFFPLLVTREGALKAQQMPLANGFIAYVTLLNERDGGIHGGTLVWEECETVIAVPRRIECYERLKAKGPTGAAAVPLFSTPLLYALTERAAHDQLPLLAMGRGGVKFQQWDGTQWTVRTDWIATDQALVRPLVEASAARYAQEKGITPRDCP
jgi:branched-chain amino acid transport system substrate-binding protein